MTKDSTCTNDKKLSNVASKKDKRQRQEYFKRYAEEHPEVAKRAARKHYEAHKDEVNKRSKLWAVNHPDKRKTIRRRQWLKEKERHIHSIRRELLVKQLGDQCIHCGYRNDIRALQIDHKNGRGRESVKFYGGTGPMYGYYLKNPLEAKMELQVLCANCNCIKREEKEEGNRRKYMPIFSAMGPLDGDYAKEIA